MALPDVTDLLSNGLWHDPLEKHFGKQCQCRRVNKSPNASDFIKNTQALCVVILSGIAEEVIVKVQVLFHAGNAAGKV